MDTMRLPAGRSGRAGFERGKYFVVELDEEREKIMILCPNCKCHIDAASTVCMYCGLVLQTAVPKRQSYQQANTIPADTRNRANRTEQRKYQRVSLLYQEIMIALLCILVILEMIQVIVLVIK